MFSKTVIVALAILVLDGKSPAQPSALPPLPPSPIEPFRRWLNMPPEEREKHLADYPEANQKILRAKLEYYEDLAPEERERRLAMLDLRYYLEPLLQETSSARREARLAAIPERYRSTIRARLAHWDRMPPGVRTNILQKDLALHYLTRIHRKPSPEETALILPPPVNPRARQKIEAWHDLPGGERKNLSAGLTRFFQLPREERQKTLETLSETEREEIQRSLDALHRMSPAQRQLCIQSFTRLANMSPREQALFLQNAARWQAMSPEERETWKKLVHNLPPLPPEALMPPLPMEEPGKATASNTVAGPR